MSGKAERFKYAGSGNTQTGTARLKEIVLLLSDAEAKGNIMHAVSESCGAHGDAHGVIMSFPIDSATGI